MKESSGAEGEKNREEFLFSIFNGFLKRMGRAIPLKVCTELHSVKSIRAFLELSPGQVLGTDGAEN